MPIPGLPSLRWLGDLAGELRRGVLHAPGLARLLEPVAWDEAGLARVADAAARGPIVFVLRNQSLVDLVALAHLAERSSGVPPVGFANELGWVVGRRDATPDGLRMALRQEKSAVLFLRRPPRVEAGRMGAAARGRGDGRELLIALMEDAAREGGHPVTLVPLTFVWSMRPERPRITAGDLFFGPADFPGEIRSAARLVVSFLERYEHCAVRVAEPISLAGFASGGADPRAVASRVSYALLRRLERERRAVVGPAEKPADRVREEVLKSPKLQRVLREMGGPEESGALTQKARAMLAELEARPDPAMMRALEPIADALASRVYAAVEVDEQGMEALREAARKGSVALLPSHKSHVDYLVLSWVLRKNKLPSPVVAAGDNLSFFPAGGFLRRAGAFFIRRESRGDRLYAAVLDAYVRRLLKDGWIIEFFLEGGRSRSGKLLPPMLGLLNLVVEAALAVDETPVFFVPVSIGYERAMEGRTFARELRGGAKERESARQLLALTELFREPWGRVSVQLGAPIELAAFRRELGYGEAGPLPPAKRRGLVAKLGHRVMQEINRVSAVTAGAMVATLILTLPGRAVLHAELVRWCERLTALLAAQGARLSPRLADGGRLRRSAVREAALLYVRAGYVREHGAALFGADESMEGAARAPVGSEEDVVYQAVEERRLRLDYAKNGIVHFFVDRALVVAASASVEREKGRAPLAEELEERTRELSKLFKYELVFRADAGFDAVFAETVALLELEGVLRGGARAREGEGGELARFYGRLLRNFFEGYRVAGRSLRLLRKGPMTKKDLALRALRVGQQMFVGGEIERSEAVGRSLIENALDAFVDEGYLTRAEGKLALVESFEDEAALAVVEARLRRLGA